MARGRDSRRWEVMRSALLESADELLGCEKNKQPDWFQESAESLGLSYSGGIMLMTDGWLQERKRI